MAIAIGNTGSSNKQGTTSFDSGAGSDRVMIVIIGRNVNSSPGSVTYAGDSLTKQVENGTGLGNFNISLWTLVAPATGTNDIVVDTSSQVLGVIVLTGASGFGAKSGTFASGTSISLVLNTTSSGNGYVIDACGTQEPSSSSVGAGQTQFASENFAGSELGYLQGSYESFTGGSNPTMSWSGASKTRRLIAIEVIEGAQSTAYEKDLTETITVSDTTIKDVSKAVIENVVLAVTSTTSMVYTKVLSETIQVVDTIIRETSKVLTDTIVVVDSAARSLTKSLTDTIVLIASANTNYIYYRTITDTLQIVDSIAKKVTRVLNETLQVVATAATQFTAIRLTETLVVSVTIDTMRTFYKNLIDNITLQVTLSKVGTYARHLYETIKLQERLRGLLNGINMLYNNKYTNKAVTYVKKYIDPK